MTTRIYVNPSTIDSNQRLHQNKPPVVIAGDQQVYCHTADILHQGAVVASVVYDSEAKGARCFVETDQEVRARP